MLTRLLGVWARALAQSFARTIARSGVRPNGLSLLGLALSGVAAVVLASGLAIPGGILVLVAGIFDMLDGALAKVTGNTTRFGAFLDSTLDRYSEAVIYTGLALYLLQTGNGVVGTLLSLVVLAGSFMVSYTRARAEGLGLKCEVGWLARPERVVLLAAGLLLTAVWPGALWVALIALAGLSNFTALQRIVYVWQLTRPQEQPPREPAQEP